MRQHETCLEYFRRRLREGWKCIELEYPNATLLSPDGIIRQLDLRDDVETLRPNGVGSLTKFDDEEPETAVHWTLVDEETADDNSTWVATLAGAGARDLYALPAHTGSGVINKVTAYERHTSDYSERAGGQMAPAIKTYATVYLGVMQISSGWNTYSKEWTQNPHESAAWTWDEIDALEAGMGDASFPGARCTQVYVEVDYTPPTYQPGTRTAHMAAKMIAEKLI